MSINNNINNVISFYGRVREDDKLYLQLKELGKASEENNVRRLLAFARDHGYYFSERDLEAFFLEAGKKIILGGFFSDDLNEFLCYMGEQGYLFTKEELEAYFTKVIKKYNVNSNLKKEEIHVISENTVLWIGHSIIMTGIKFARLLLVSA